MKKYLIGLVMAAMLLPSVGIQAQYPLVYLKMLLKDRTSYNMMKEIWDAGWIEVDGTKPKDYGVYYFRKDIDLAAKPATFKVYVSGDTRYKLYVNGELFNEKEGESIFIFDNVPLSSENTEIIAKAYKIAIIRIITPIESFL